MKKKKSANNIKINKFIIIGGLLLFLVVGIRVGYISLSEEVEGTNLQEFAKSRTTKKDILIAKRGSIKDKNGNVIAQNVSSYTLIAYLDSSRTTNSDKPMHVVDKEYTAKKLAPVLGVDKEYILNCLNKKNAYQTEFGSKGKGLTELKKDEILALGLPGLDFIETQKRYYPYGTFLSYTVGYAKENKIENENGVVTNDIVGEMGIEKEYDDILAGEDGYTLYQKDRKGYKIADTKEIKVDAKDGSDVYLTIDANIQLFIDQAISKAKQDSKWEWYTVILADAKTGAILGMSGDPTFNPNKRDMVTYLDNNVAVAYEPGSTMKIFSYMAAMENGLYSGTKKYKTGIYKAKDGTEIGDWDRKGWGYITYDQGFALSSNTAVMNLVKNGLNREMLREYYKRLGFGSKTGIELPNEVSGKLNFKYETEVLNASFGQGITTTPIQNIKALTSLTNDGVLLKPYLVDKIVDTNTDKVVYEGKREELGVVASKKTVEKMKSLMADVVNGTSKTCTGYPYYMKGYNFIAKTGTAQVADSKKGGYRGDTIKGIAGMFPADDPQVIVYLAAKNPKDKKTGSGVTPMKSVVNDIVTNVSSYLNIYDGKDNEPKYLKTYRMENFINKDTETTTNYLKNKGLDVVVLGKGNRIIEQYPSKNVDTTEKDKIFLRTNDIHELEMPDLKGYSLNEVKTITSFMNLNVKFEGNGYVNSQSIKAGTKVKEGDELAIKLVSKYNGEVKK